MAAVLALVAWLHPGRSDRVLRHAVTIGMTIALVALFIYGLRLVRGGARFDRRIALSGFVVLALVALVVPPFQSSDLYAYGQIGWLQAEYGLNPYAHVPMDFGLDGRDPMFTRTWRDAPCVYGFLFAHVAHGIAWWGDGDPELTLLLFKIFSALTWLAVGALVARELARREASERHRALFWLLWSPFVVLQGVANGHNDGLFALFLLLAYVAARSRHPVGVLPALACAALIKLIAIAVAPFAFVYLVRRVGVERTVGHALLALTLAAGLSMPYTLDLAVFQWDGIRAQLAEPSYSLISAVTDTYAAALGSLEGTWFAPDRFQSALQLMALAAFGVWVVVRLVRAARAAAYGADDMLRDTVLVLFALIIFASAKFFPWYLLMILPAALVLPREDRVREAVLWLTVSWMLVFTGVGKARILDALLMTAVPLVLLHRRHARMDESPAA